MAKSKDSKDTVSKLESQQNRQARLIRQLKQTNRWVLWIAGIIILFLLLGMIVMGYASNWWQDPETADRTGQFAADGTQGSGGSSSTNSGQNNGSSSAARESSSDKTSTTTNTSTTTSTTTNNTTTEDKNKSLIETLLEDIQPGGNINDIKNRALELGIGVDCNNTLIAVQECKFSAGDYNITTKNLITSDSITGILNNLTGN